MRLSGPEFSIDLQDFVLEVYVVGYRVKGESIVVLFKERNRTFYSIVIDSYCKRYRKQINNRAESILTQNGVNTIPMLIMSHPHEDHIVGMESLIDCFCDENSQFYYPARSFDINNPTITLTNKERKILKLVRKNNTVKKTFSNPVGVPSGGYVLLRNVRIYDVSDYEKVGVLPVEIVAVTPISSVNDAKAANMFLNPNDLSISVLINVNGYYLLLASDTTNDHIAQLDRELMSYVKFIKIPHHASNTSDKLTKLLLPDQLDYACCTTYNVGRSHLPLISVLNEYKKVSHRIDIAGCASNDKRTGLYGELCYKFRLGHTGMESSVLLQGVTTQM